jgi:tetratricopeptide (TPR) repeat protein
MLISTYKKLVKYTISIYYRLSLILLFLIFLPDRLLARESQGEIVYKNGAFGEALKFYNRELEKRGDHPELLYNKGTTCLTLKRYEESAQAFKAASTHAPVELKRKISDNLGNTLFEQGQNFRRMVFFSAEPFSDIMALFPRLKLNLFTRKNWLGNYVFMMSSSLFFIATKQRVRHFRVNLCRGWLFPRADLAFCGAIKGGLMAQLTTFCGFLLAGTDSRSITGNTSVSDLRIS